MNAGRIYSREELAALSKAVEAGERPECPACRLPLRPREVAAPKEVSYVRRRTWWLCPGCGRSAVLDRPRRQPPEP